MKKLIKFLKNIDFIYELGFTDIEIEQAMVDSEISKSDILEEKEVEKLPTYGKYHVMKENHKFTYNKSVAGLRGRTRKERTEVIGYKIEVPNSYQIRNSEILFNLLKNKFEWFTHELFTKKTIKSYTQQLTFVNLRDIPKQLRKYTLQELLDNKEITYIDTESLWKVYWGYNTNQEIYLNTDVTLNNNIQSIYVPLKALINKDWNSIVKRNEEYLMYFYKYKSEQLKIALSVLDSPQAQLLKKTLENKHS